MKRPEELAEASYARLCQVVREECIGPWFEKANPAFDGKTPAEVLKEEGGLDKIDQMIYHLDSGVS